VVVGGHDEGGIAWTPHLREGWIVESIGPYPLDPCVKGVERRSRDAVLETGPCRPTKRIRTQRQALIERLDPAPLREDLIPRHVTWAWSMHGHRVAQPSVGPIGVMSWK